MAKYLLIESRDPFDSGDSSSYLELAGNLAGAGNEVTLFLVQNGVLPARPSKHSQALSDTAAAGVTVLADDFSLRERGIDANALAGGVAAAPLDTVIDQMVAGAKPIWH